MSPRIKRMFVADGVFAIAGLSSQWMGARYATVHGLESWPFGFVPFLVMAFLVFMSTGIYARAGKDTRDKRRLILFSRFVAWSLCAVLALAIWLHVYGS